MQGEPMSAKARIYAKRVFASAKLESHREEEGAMFLDRLPTNRGPEADRSLRHPERHKVGEPSVTQLAARTAFAERARVVTAYPLDCSRSQPVGEETARKIPVHALADTSAWPSSQRRVENP